MTPKPDSFCVFILTNGRPDKVKTYTTLRKQGYTGQIYLLVDDLDPTRDLYEEKFYNEVYIFDKKEIAGRIDQGDNFNDLRAIIYARNASFEIAQKIGIDYFIQLDDDYTNFNFRFNSSLNYHFKSIKDLDEVFRILLEFYISSGVDSIALSQGGDFIGGEDSDNAQQVLLKRKCMNSFFCKTSKPFKFIGRINEDVNTYTRLASTGLLLFTLNQVSLQQLQTQTNSGGMTEMYLDSGTYIKSFYSVMYHPSSVKIKLLNTKNPRLHHSIAWINTVPLLLKESTKKINGNSQIKGVP